MVYSDEILHYEKVISLHMEELNSRGYAVIFAITGENGTGKTHFAKKILTRLPFYQSFNLGLITKTIRCLTDMNDITMLENFRDLKVDQLFSRIIQYACAEYQKNGVNVLIDGVQIDSVELNNDSNILGGVILEVSHDAKRVRNDKPTTHFKRKLEIHAATDVRRYMSNEGFLIVDNNGDFMETYDNILRKLNQLLVAKMKELNNG